MTTIALDATQLHALDAETRRAWAGYSERVRELTGEHYAQVEEESWTELQDELNRLGDKRRTLIGNAD